MPVMPAPMTAMRMVSVFDMGVLLPALPRVMSPLCHWPERFTGTASQSFGFHHRRERRFRFSESIRIAVLGPESFRGGCSFGVAAGKPTLNSSAVTSDTSKSGDVKLVAERNYFRRATAFFVLDAGGKRASTSAP